VLFVVFVAKLFFPVVYSVDILYIFLSVYTYARVGL